MFYDRNVSMLRKKDENCCCFHNADNVVLNLNSIEVVSTSPATVLMKHSKSER